MKAEVTLNLLMLYLMMFTVINIVVIFLLSFHIFKQIKIRSKRIFFASDMNFDDCTDIKKEAQMISTANADNPDKVIAMCYHRIVKLKETLEYIKDEERGERT